MISEAFSFFLNSLADKTSDEFFSELRKLVSDKFETDPKFWKKQSQ